MECRNVETGGLMGRRISSHGGPVFVERDFASQRRRMIYRNRHGYHVEGSTLYLTSECVAQVKLKVVAYHQQRVGKYG